MAIITGDSGNNILVGTTENDIINGLGGNDELSGQEGDDTLNAGLGATDRVDGGIGIDTLVIDYSSLGTNIRKLSNSYYTTGNRTYYSNIERFQITGGSGNDELYGGLYNDILNGGAGDDYIDGGAGNDILNGGAGNDLIIKGAGNDTVDGGSGIDTLVDADFSADTTGRTLTITGTTLTTLVSGGNTYRGLEFLRNIIAGSGNDNIRYTTTILDNNQLNGGAGDDILGAGLGAADRVDGGIGIDTLVIDYSSLGTNIRKLSNSYYTTGNRTYYSNIEQFYLTGGSGNDELYGGLYNDILNGGAGDDYIDGGAGNDIITQGAGNDTVNGGAGIDTLVDADLSADTIGRNLNISGSTIGTIVSGGNTYQGFEFFVNVTAGSGNDAIRFTSSTAADNNIRGGAGNDLIEAGAGNDTLDGGSGDDVLRGGVGNDTYVVDSVGDVVSETSTLATEIDMVRSAISYTLGANLENLTLTGTAAINGTGNSLANTITGNSGNNTLNGGSGNDRLIGGSGNDILFGGDGNDTLNGVGSEFGRATIDRLNGGNNNDLFILGDTSAIFYNDGINTNAGLGDYALIEDFNTTQDTIQLRGTANSYLLGSSPIAGITGTSIYWDSNGDRILTSTDELIAIAQGTSGLNLTASYFSYVS